MKDDKCIIVVNGDRKIGKTLFTQILKELFEDLKDSPSVKIINLPTPRFYMTDFWATDEDTKQKVARVEDSYTQKVVNQINNSDSQIIIIDEVNSKAGLQTLAELNHYMFEVIIKDTEIEMRPELNVCRIGVSGFKPTKLVKEANELAQVIYSVLH